MDEREACGMNKGNLAERLQQTNRPAQQWTERRTMASKNDPRTIAPTPPNGGAFGRRAPGSKSRWEDLGPEPEPEDDDPAELAADDDDASAVADGEGGDAKERTRSRTIPMKRLSKQEIQDGLSLLDYMDYRRPQTRAECEGGIRPCPFVSCKHHLYLDVNPTTGSIKINFPDLEVWQMAETCALDISDRGGITLEEVGMIMNLTRERIRQVEVSGLEKLQAEEFAVDLEDVFRS